VKGVAEKKVGQWLYKENDPVSALFDWSNIPTV